MAEPVCTMRGIEDIDFSACILVYVEGLNSANNSYLSLKISYYASAAFIWIDVPNHIMAFSNSHSCNHW